MNGVLRDKVGFVTGAAGGLGAAIVRQYAAAGAVGIALDVTRKFPDLPDSWVSVTGDVSDEADLLYAVNIARQEFGRLDIAVANAAVVPPWRRMDALEETEWDHVFGVNVRGVAFTIKCVLPLMKNEGGSIIAMGSLNSCYAHSQQCLYTASKHAVLGIVRAAALDLGRFNIRVNAIGPGPVATQALLQRIEDRARQGGLAVKNSLDNYASETALGHIASEDDVAAAATFLASDAAVSMTGQMLRVDAGLGIGQS